MTVISTMHLCTCVIHTLRTTMLNDENQNANVQSLAFMLCCITRTLHSHHILRYIGTYYVRIVFLIEIVFVLHYVGIALCCWCRIRIRLTLTCILVSWHFTVRWMSFSTSVHRCNLEFYIIDEMKLRLFVRIIQLIIIIYYWHNNSIITVIPIIVIL